MATFPEKFEMIQTDITSDLNSQTISISEYMFHGTEEVSKYSFNLEKFDFLVSNQVNYTDTFNANYICETSTSDQDDLPKMGEYSIDQYQDTHFYKKWKLSKNDTLFPKFDTIPYTTLDSEEHLFLLTRTIDNIKYSKIMNITVSQCLPNCVQCFSKGQSLPPYCIFCKNGYDPINGK